MMIETNKPLTTGELKARADFALYLENKGVPLEEAIGEADTLIAARRAFGVTTPEPDPSSGTAVDPDQLTLKGW